MVNPEITLASTDLSAIEIFNKGRQATILADREKEAAKKFTLRGGSAGCITEHGEFIGKNPHEVLARFMGYQTKIDQSGYNVFDTGYGNEEIWERVITASGWSYKSDSNYPLIVKDLFPYPLTGRPDMVFGDTIGGEFIPKVGVEHKAICSVSAAKIKKDFRPKTENLIQAGTYSLFFGLPWLLVYTQGSNFYSNKAGKIEFPIGWTNGNLWFELPTGERVDTIITASGIIDYYAAIVEAYETKDHSWFRRGHIGYDGQPAQYWDNYNSLLLMVDSKLSWDAWVDDLEIAADSDYIIKLNTQKGKEPTYILEHVVDGTRTTPYYTLEEARDAVRRKAGA